MKRICAICGDTIVIDENNSIQAIQYKKKFYHFNCFSDLCEKRKTNPRKDIADNWTYLKNTIHELVDETTKEQQLLVQKDNLYQWIFHQYGTSFLSNRMYMKFDDIYNGTLKGLAYSVDPIELLAEWKYYWDDLCFIRRSKNLSGEAAINYDLAVLLGKNAEYRKIKEKERLAREARMQQMAEPIIPQMKAKWQPKNKVADLYQEMNGGEDNE